MYDTRFGLSSSIMNYEDDLPTLHFVLHDNEQAYRELLGLRGTDAQSGLDWLQHHIDVPEIPNSLRTSICQTMIRLSKRSGLAPSCLTIRGVMKLGEHPVAGGGFGDIWKGRLGEDQLVCLKVVKVYLTSDVKKSLKEYLREAIIWRQLKHPNLLPCLGLYYLDDSHERICLVSPWMENGNLVDFLSTRPRESVNHIQLIHDITSGLSYLHALNIVHGDLKGANILISHSHRACIADFGLSRVSDSMIHQVTSTAEQIGGSARWSAPEIHDGQSSTSRSDIYSCGCLFYEVITGRPPFFHLKRDPAIAVAVLRGDRPSKPLDFDVQGELWSLMEQCWQAEPALRPTAEDVLRHLLTFGDISLAEEWDSTLFTELRRSMVNDPLRGTSGIPQALVELVQSLGIRASNRDVHTQLPASGGEQDPNKHTAPHNANTQPPLKPVVPLKVTANRWDRKYHNAVDADSPELVEQKVRALLNKITMEKFDSISDQIIVWANMSENEKDGRTLIQVIRLIFGKATDEANFSEMYARLCRKVMDRISPQVQDEGIRNVEGKPISGGQLFRKYLLNRCQEDFERGWTTAAKAVAKANVDKEEGEVALYSNEYYAAQKAKRQGLGLVRFIGELFKLQMLTERIMHECVKKLLDHPEEDSEIESLWTLLITVGQVLDTAKAKAHMDAYFYRIKEVMRSPNVSPRMQFLLQDMIKLRERRWIAKNAIAVPQTIGQIRETTAEQKSLQDYIHGELPISLSVSQHGSGRANANAVGPDSWGPVAGRVSFGVPRTHRKKTLSEADVKKKIEGDLRVFFISRNIDEAEGYFAKLRSQHDHQLLVDGLVSKAVESKQADAELVGNLLKRASSKNLCSPSAFEQAFASIASVLDDTAIDAPNAPAYLAIMLKGAGLTDNQRKSITSKSEENGQKVFELSS